MTRTVLGFSGSAAGAAAIGWLRQHLGCEVVTVTIDIGQGDELAAIREQALALGAVRAHVIDAREELVRDYLLPSLQAGALMSGHALGYPLIANRLVDIARMEQATSIAHAAESGAEGSALDAAIRSIAAGVDVIPVRSEWDVPREQLAAFARHRGGSVGEAGDARIDASIWGRRIVGATSSSDPFTLTRDPHDCPEDAALVDVAFVEGVPVSANGIEMSLNEMIESLETIAGAHGVGRLSCADAVTEAPAAQVLSAAHEAIERAALGDDMAALKRQLAGLYSTAMLTGGWFSDIRQAIDAFARVTSARVSGTVRLSLQEGRCAVTACSVTGSSRADSSQPRAVA